MKRTAAFIAVMTLTLFSGFAEAQTTAPAAVEAAAPTDAVVIELSGQINDFSVSHVRTRFEAAKQLGAKVVILRINTWGGGLAAALEISNFIKQQPATLHTIAYVDEKAVSAGALIAIACDEIVMRPGAMIGDCAPIVMDGQLFPTERAKAESPVLADFYDSSIRNHHDTLLVQAMVTLGRVVYYVQSQAGERKFVDQANYDRLIKEQWKPVNGVPNPVDDDSTLLTINGELAARLGLATLSPDVSTLATDRRLNVIRTYAPGAGESVVALLNSTAVRGVLIALFLLTAYVSLTHPGTGLPEVICVLALATLIGVPLMTGWASWLEVLIILVGIALLALEIFVIPGFGVTGISGLVLILVGLVMTFAPSEPGSLPGILPALPGTREALKQGLLVTLIGAVTALASGFWLSRHLTSLPYFRRLVLQTSVGSTVDPDADVAREILDAAWPAIGSAGVAATDLRPGGRATFRDDVINDVRHTDVVCDVGFVTAGTPLTVYEKDGGRVVVRPAV